MKKKSFYLKNIFKFFIFFYISLYCSSCDDKSLIMDPTNPNMYNFQNFLLNQETSKSLRKENYSSGSSPYLYSGNVTDSEHSYIVLKINQDIINQSFFCDDTTIVEINKIKLRVMTSDLNDENFQINQMQNSIQSSLADNETTLPENDFLVSHYIDAYFVLQDGISDFEENNTLNHLNENINSIKDQLIPTNILPLEFFYNEPPYNVTSMYIDISDLYDENEENLKQGICDNIASFFIVLDYNPVSSVSSRKYIEFYSSDYINTFLNPALFIDYNVAIEGINKISKFSINEINSNYIDDTDFIYNDDIESEQFGTILSFNIPDESFDLSNIDTTQINLEADSLSVLLNSSSQSNQLFDVLIHLNESYIDSISDIKFFFNDAYFTFNDFDPSNDNWNETDSSGAEGNQIYDIGENFDDFGFDNCIDENETGNFNFKCDTSLSFISIHNPEGTENNLILDWEDKDSLNGLWDEGEGEKWYDFGEDNCKDNYELGNGNCLSDNAIIGNVTVELLCNEETNIDSLVAIYGDEISLFDMELCSNETYDFNEDNQNRDPANDDYICNEWNDDFTNCNENNEGKEDNEIYDIGEPYLDFGIDQIPDSLEAYIDYEYPDDNWNEVDSTGTENNGIYDFGEIFFDTGIDSLYSYQEDGYNYYGKENNYDFDTGYEHFDDFGIDNIENGNEGDLVDDYILDPNDDNSTESNGLLEFNDIGIDRCIDNYELGDGNCLSDNAITGNVNVELLCNEETNLDSLITLYGDEISSFNMELCFNDTYDFNSDNWSDSNDLGTEGNSSWDWIDIDNNTEFDALTDTIHELTEYWDDLGSDGLIDSLEVNYGNNYAMHAIEDNLFTLNISDFPSIGDTVILDSLIIDEDSNNEISMWISMMERIDENTYKFYIDYMSTVDIVGMQFQLDHEYIYQIIDETQIGSRSFYPHQFDDSNNNFYPEPDEILTDADKYIQDYSLYPLLDFEEDSLSLSNSNGIVMNLDFEDLDLFILNNQNSIIANTQTKLILYIEEQVNIDNDLDLFFEVYNDDIGEFISFELINPYRVLDDMDSVLIDIGPLIQKYLYNEIIFNPNTSNGIRMKIGDYSNNFSNISFIKNDSVKSPRLEVLYQYDE